MCKSVLEAFDLGAEKKAVRESYTMTPFGQSCLLARRLVEKGVPVVEVTFFGWDTHADNFTAVAKLSKALDGGFASLLTDLEERKLLDKTLIVWMGEFGRTPRINVNAGRDHYPLNFTVVLAGAKLKRGVVIGKTSDDGLTITERAVTVEELFATIYRAVDVEPSVGTVTEIREGASYVARIPWLWVTITLFAVILMLQLAPQQVLLPKLVSDHFGRGVGAYAALSAMVGVGTVCGTLLFGHLQPRRRRGVISYWLWLINSVAVAGMALAPWYALAGGLALVRGVCIGFGVAVWETMLQELVPPRLLGRVISLDFFGSFGLMPVGLAIWGVLAGIAPPGPMIAGGALVSAGMIGVALTRPWLRAVE